MRYILPGSESSDTFKRCRRKKRLSNQYVINIARFNFGRACMIVKTNLTQYIGLAKGCPSCPHPASVAHVRNQPCNGIEKKIKSIY